MKSGIAVLLLLLVFGSNSIYQSLENNLWSLDFARSKIGVSASFPPSPPQHPRAALWLAREALAQNDPTHAQALVASLAEKGDVDALRIFGTAFAAKGEFTAVVQAWSQAKDLNSLLAAARAAAAEGRSEDALLAFRAAYELDTEKGTLPLAVFLWDSKIRQTEAEALIREALARYPRSRQRLDWSRRLGSFLRAQNRWDESEAILQELLAEYPQDWQAHIELGWVYYQRGDGAAAALAAFRDAIAIDPALGNGYFASGQVMAQEKEYDQAEDWFIQAIERNPEMNGWWLTRGNVARSSGNLQLALEVYQQIIERFPDWAPGYYEMAWAYHLSNAPGEAIRAIEQALALEATPSEWYYIRAAEIYARADWLEEALQAYRTAQAINPDTATSPLFYFLKNAYQDREAAAALLRQALADHPNTSQRSNWLLQLGDLLREDQRLEEAREIYQLLLSEQPENWAAHIGLGWVYYYTAAGLEAAQDEFQAAIAIAPQQGNGYLAIGQALVQEKRFAESDAWFVQALERNPDQAWWWLERANAARSDGQLAQSVTLYLEIAARFPDWEPAAYELAWAYRQNSQLTEAVQAIQEALAWMKTPNAWYYYRAGLIYEESGMFNEAVDAYTQALALMPERQEFVEALARLQGKIQDRGGE